MGKDLPPRLVASLRVTTVCGAAAVAGFLLLLQLPSPVRIDWKPLLPALFVFFLVAGLFRVALPLNRRRGETIVLPTLGPANCLTLLRGVLTAVLAAFWIWPQDFPFRPQQPLAWLPGILYLIVALLDLLDGLVARRTRRVTLLGERLDTRLDALGLLTVSLAGVRLGQLPAFYLAVGAAYYVSALGRYLRLRRGLPTAPLQPRPRARFIAGLNMGFAGSALLPVFHPPTVQIAAAVFALPLLAGFVRDWRIISGRTLRTSGPIPAGDPPEAYLSKRVLPVALRAAVLVTGLALLERKAALTGAAPGTLVPGYCVPFDSAEAALFAVALLLVAVGALGRSAAVCLLMFCGLCSAVQPTGPLWLLLSLETALLAVTGTGCLSLWTPEERLIYRQHSATPAHGCQVSG
jgi:CDP-diacylglycerol--glycerol-3-phosphate 3-phosphatidyltransferase